MSAGNGDVSNATRIIAGAAVLLRDGGPEPAPGRRGPTRIRTAGRPPGGLGARSRRLRPAAGRWSPQRKPAGPTGHRTRATLASGSAGVTSFESVVTTEAAHGNPAQQRTAPASGVSGPGTTRDGWKRKRIKALADGRGSIGQARPRKQAAHIGRAGTARSRRGGSGRGNHRLSSGRNNDGCQQEVTHKQKTVTV